MFPQRFQSRTLVSDLLCVSAVTIISGVIMLILFVSELQYFLTKEVRFL